MAKEIIAVTVTVKKTDVLEEKSDLLAVGILADSKKLSPLCKALDTKLDAAISKILGTGDFKGKANTSALLYCDGKIGSKRVLLVGLGDKASAETVRNAAALAANNAVQLKAQTIVLALHSGVRGSVDALGQAVAEGAYFGSYRYDEYVTQDGDGRGDTLDVVVGDSDGKKVTLLCKGVAVGNVLGAAQSFARTIANRPGNVINPATLADAAKKMANNTAGLSCTVLDEKALKAKKMGGILAVGSGSSSKPRLIVIKYTPAAGSKNSKTVGLVGKAITFDSGGISIKPAAHMEEMKFDKSGGVAVLATMQAIAALKPKLNVYGIIPAAENIPSSTSYRPGDIVTTYSGKTVEVQNTDAEGRMILCDGLHYAVEQKCDVIVDIATLTGACVVALGKVKAGLMGNDDGLIKQLQAASKDSGEAVWHLPCGTEYAEQMKSKIADLKNVGGRWGGACTAAAFLREFVGDAKWAHVDMAGVEMFEGNKTLGNTGASGFGVRLLTTYIMNAAGKK